MCSKKFNKDKKAFHIYKTTEKEEKDNTYEDDIYCEDDNPTQDISVAIGTPMICRRTKNNKDDEDKPFYYNNEVFKISNILSQVIPLDAQIKK